MDTMKNHEGYKDPTAGRAIRNVTRRERRGQDEMPQTLTYRLEENRAFQECTKHSL
ncbi:MAG: hypothetical protein HFG82_09930 [Dorea sp.]|jgi:hypothetical protein|nr:hypothetical protein [Dorea sp.]